jgi:cytochrome c556
MKAAWQDPKRDHICVTGTVRLAPVINPREAWNNSEHHDGGLSMRFKILLAGLALTLGAASMAQGADDVLAQRQALMKANAGAAKTIFQMVQGKEPFDAAAAQAAFEKLAADMKIVPTLFPEGSDQGKTTASPAIWQDKAGFDALAAIKASATAVGGSCQSCHEKFRIKKT